MLGYAEWGDPEGVPVVLFHGTPDSRLFCPDTYRTDTTTTDLGVRLITIDRPGYGRSDPLSGRTLLGYANDVASVADALRVERFPLVGMSSGGAYAMGSAIAMPERITTLGLVSSVGPCAEIPEYVEGLDEERRSRHELFNSDLAAGIERALEENRWLLDSPEAILDPAGWPDAERWLVEDLGLRSPLIEEAKEAGRFGALGAAWDNASCHRPWGFSPRDIRVPTYLWGGELDGMVDREEFDYLARTIPGVHVTVWPNEGHVAVLHGRYWGEVLATMKATA
jgi:pimeloyl-ACP methyl ester carboxylesterase